MSLPVSLVFAKDTRRAYHWQPRTLMEWISKLSILFTTSLSYNLTLAPAHTLYLPLPHIHSTGASPSWALSSPTYVDTRHPLGPREMHLAQHLIREQQQS